jgi:MurNAc alpha-1-phosphate uridylyltransferase
MLAFILAAGRGERLRPLTDHLPKALVEAGGQPLIAWHFERLAAAGFERVIVNLAHLGDRIETFAGDGRRWNLRIAYSYEPQALETAGALAHARGAIGTEPHLVINADVYCEIDLRTLSAVPLGRNLAHLVLVPNPAHRRDGDFTLVESSAGNPGLAGADHRPRYTYSGVSIVSPLLTASVKAGEKMPLAPLLRAAADAGRLGGELYSGRWHDVGTLERLQHLQNELQTEWNRRRPDPPSA